MRKFEGFCLRFGTKRHSSQGFGFGLVRAHLYVHTFDLYFRLWVARPCGAALLAETVRHLCVSGAAVSSLRLAGQETEGGGCAFRGHASLRGPVTKFGRLVVDAVAQSVVVQSDQLLSHDVHIAAFARKMRPSSILNFLAPRTRFYVSYNARIHLVS